MKKFLFLCPLGAIGSNLNMTTLTGGGVENVEHHSENSSVPQSFEEASSICVRNITNNNNSADEGITFQVREKDTNVSAFKSIESKEIIVRREKFSEKISSLDSEVSEASTLVSYNSTDTLGNESDSSSTCGDGRLRRTRITHQSIRSVMSDSEVELNGVSDEISILQFKPVIFKFPFISRKFN